MTRHLWPYRPGPNNVPRNNRFEVVVTSPLSCVALLIVITKGESKMEMSYPTEARELCKSSFWLILTLSEWRWEGASEILPKCWNYQRWIRDFCFRKLEEGWNCFFSFPYQAWVLKFKVSYCNWLPLPWAELNTGVKFLFDVFSPEHFRNLSSSEPSLARVLSVWCRSGIIFFAGVGLIKKVVHSSEALIRLDARLRKWKFVRLKQSFKCCSNQE